MLKKIIGLVFLLFSIKSYSNNDCFLYGKIDLPNVDLSNASVLVYNYTSKIDSDNNYCIKENISQRPYLNIHLIYNDTVILKNTFYNHNNSKKNNFNLNLNNAISELICSKLDCNNNPYYFTDHNYTKEFSLKLIDKYYKNIKSNFSYDRIEKKILVEERKYQLDKDNSDFDIDKYYFPLDNMMINKSNIAYNKSITKNDKNKFLNNNEILKGLNDKSMHPDLVVLNWIRYMYYYGNNFSYTGALYTKNMKQNFFQKKNLDEINKFKNLYKAKNAVRKVNEDKDKEFYKKTFDDLNGLFDKNNYYIFNKEYNFSNVSFKFEENSWRLDTISINKEK